MDNIIVKLRKDYGVNEEQAHVLCDPAKEIIVPAGAGSGKTKTLISKLVYLLETGTSLDELLVLTFTNKAAAEMKERLKGVLNKKEMFEQVNKVDSADISTFDAFALKFVKQNCSLINLDANVEVFNDAMFEISKQKIMSDIILKNMLIDNSDMNEFLQKYSYKSNEINLSKTLISLYFKLKNEYNSFSELKAENLIEKNDNSFNIDVNFYKEKISELVPGFFDIEVNQKKFTILDRYAQSLRNQEEFNDFTRLPNTSYKGLLTSTPADKYIKDQVAEVFNDIKELYNAKVSTKNIDETTQKYLQVAKIILKILKQFDNEIDKLKISTNKYEFGDIAEFLNIILEKAPLTLKRLREKIKYICVDEYQDTSNVQTNFLNKIIEDNDNVKVLYVGDIKQSIYKFRNAVPKTFIDKQATVKNIALRNNYRSHHSIIDFTNNFFSRVLTNEKDHDIIYKNNHEMNSLSKLNEINDKSFGVYCLEKYVNPDEKPRNELIEEIFMVASKIKELKQANIIKSYSKVAILARNKNSFPRIIDIFKYLELPLVVQIKQEIHKDTYLLKLIANILMLALNFKTAKNGKLQRFWYASLARSEIFEKTDFEILKSVIDLEYKEFKERFVLVIPEDVQEKLLQIKNNIFISTNKEILDLVISLFDINGSILKTSDINLKELQLNNLYTLTSVLSDMNILGDDFISFIYEYAYDENAQMEVDKNQVSGDDCIILTNIHQSKGLEYDYLFLIDLDKKFKSTSSIFEFNKEQKLLINLNNYYLNDKANLAVVKKINNQYNEYKSAQALKEELRILYVAVTRAKKALYLISTPKEDYSKLNSFNDYLYNFGFLDFIKQENISKYKTPIKDLSFYDNLRNDQYYYPSFLDELPNIKLVNNIEENIHTKASMLTTNLLSSKEKENMLQGTKLHHQLEYANFLEETTEKAVDNLKKIKFANYFVHESIKILREFNFSYTVENKTITGIIDLVCIYKDCVHIIDYKTNDINKIEYVQQLNTYKEYLTLIYPNLLIKMFLYSITKNIALEL